MLVEISAEMVAIIVASAPFIIIGAYAQGKDNVRGSIGLSSRGEFLLFALPVATLICVLVLLAFYAGMYYGIW